MAKRSSILAAIAAAVFGIVVVITSCSSTKPRPPADVTFTKDIEPLVRAKCQTCHHDGGIAPFSLITYEQVKGYAAAAKEKVARREMPPWGAFDDDACSVNHKFKDNLSLTQDQIDL
ncbi:MAG: hypothetical protein K0S65_5673, partial [Labilithrix sp.]|nr:hypothetical protein [Labilithrix sp.]